MRHRLVQRISSSGPIPFEAFMAEALYGAGGFFASAELRSQKGGDFLTSPEVSPHFGKTIAAWVCHYASILEAPASLVEVGGGSGSLLRPLLGALESSLDVWAIEASPAARDALASIDGVHVVSSLNEAPDDIRGVIVANELLDNLPMAIAQKTAQGWRERWVGVDGEALCFVDAAPRSDVLAWLEAHAGPVGIGGWVEVQLEASRWLSEASAKLTTGAILLIDYGDTAENLLPRRQDGTLRTYRAHHLGPHPLDEPGATDITADVNFTALVGVADELGHAAKLHRQDDFLARWGLRDRIAQRRHEELELARSGHEMQRLRVRSERSEMETLMHPRGLGDFRVLEIAVKTALSGSPRE